MFFRMVEPVHRLGQRQLLLGRVRGSIADANETAARQLLLRLVDLVLRPAHFRVPRLLLLLQPFERAANLQLDARECILGVMRIGRKRRLELEQLFE
jgi:hypothetical protein